MEWFIAALLIWIASAAKATQDILAHKFSWSVFRNLNDKWWDPTWSWRNKYKYNNPSLGEKFLFSTNILVFLTDAWHFFQWVHNMALWSALAVIGWNACELQLIGFLLILLSARIMYGVVFQLFYNNLLED